MSKSKLETTLDAQLKHAGINGYKREYQFSPTRKFRTDFAWPHLKIAAEIDGGLYHARSGHRSYTGVRRDIEKHNEYMFEGWLYIRLTDRDVMTNVAVTKIESLLFTRRRQTGVRNGDHVAG